MTLRLSFLVALVALTVVAGFWWRSRQGAVRQVLDGDVLRAADLGADLGAAATLVQFSSAACAPCRATRRLLADLTARTPGLAHVELDAADHLGLVRRFDVLRTPTVLVLDKHGRVAHRFSGVPDLARLRRWLPAHPLTQASAS